MGRAQGVLTFLSCCGEDSEELSLYPGNLFNEFKAKTQVLITRVCLQSQNGRHQFSSSLPLQAGEDLALHPLRAPRAGAAEHSPKQIPFLLDTQLECFSSFPSSLSGHVTQLGSVGWEVMRATFGGGPGEILL